MITLIIDTSTERALVAITNGPDLLFTHHLPFGALSSKLLLSTITTGFEQLNTDPSFLKRIAVGIGPGLFTGIRVGVATAKGMAFGLNLPLIPFSSLHGFVAPGDGMFISAIDARLSGVYILPQLREGDLITPLSNPQLIDPKALNTLDLLVGPNFSRLGIEGLEVCPHAGHLARLVSNLSPQNDFQLIY